MKNVNLLLSGKQLILLLMTEFEVSGKYYNFEKFVSATLSLMMSPYLVTFSEIW